MSIQRRNPEQLHTTPGYHHITIANAREWIFLAGQCPLTPDGDIVAPDDLDAQVDQIAVNTLIALRAAGAEPAEVVRTVIYVVSDSQQDLAAVWNRFTRSVIAPAFTTASTLLGVAQLGFPGQRVELDVTAAIGGSSSDGGPTRDNRRRPWPPWRRQWPSDPIAFHESRQRRTLDSGSRNPHRSIAHLRGMPPAGYVGPKILTPSRAVASVIRMVSATPRTPGRR